jgi:Domain of unknown function (DUF397)
MNWTKSTHSGQGNCIEVAPLHDGVAVRDSKNPTGPVLRFSGDAWQAFVKDIKDGRVGIVED